MLPTPLRIEGSVYKIFYGTRNANNQSSISYSIIDLENPSKVVEHASIPVLCPGRLGTFDDNGVLPSCILEKNNEMLLYTIGFKPGGTTRMDLYGGLAISADGGHTFNRWSEAPIIERTRANPMINTAPWVIRDQSEYKMYYVSGVEWLNQDLPRYNIQMASSTDALFWRRDGQVAIDFEEGENALARPYVLFEDGKYHMWFSAKGESYRALYAISSDGISWERDPKTFQFQGNSHDIDDEMVCYPAIISHKGQKIMLYNGNDYGLRGICMAVEE